VQHVVEEANAGIDANGAGARLRGVPVGGTDIQAGVSIWWERAGLEVECELELGLGGDKIGRAHA